VRLKVSQVNGIVIGTFQTALWCGDISKKTKLLAMEFTVGG